MGHKLIAQLLVKYYKIEEYEIKHKNSKSIWVDETIKGFQNSM